MPAVPTITVSDNQDGTGGICTIAGSTAGSTNVVWALSPAVQTWVNKGSCTGDGTVAVASASGYFWLYCASSLSGSTVLSNLIWTGFTSSPIAVATRIRNAVYAGIQNIVNAGKLPGIKLTSILAPKMVPDLRQTDPTLFPLVMVLAGKGLREAPFGPKVNVYDDKGHPVLIRIVVRSGDDFATDMPSIDLWRERITRYFISQRLPGVTDLAWFCKVEPGPIVDFQPPGAFTFAESNFVLRFWTREPRGI